MAVVETESGPQEVPTNPAPYTPPPGFTPGGHVVATVTQNGISRLQTPSEQIASDTRIAQIQAAQQVRTVAAKTSFIDPQTQQSPAQRTVGLRSSGKFANNVQVVGINENAGEVLVKDQFGNQYWKPGTTNQIADAKAKLSSGEEGYNKPYDLPIGIKDETQPAAGSVVKSPVADVQDKYKSYIDFSKNTFTGSQSDYEKYQSDLQDAITNTNTVVYNWRGQQVQVPTLALKTLTDLPTPQSQFQKLTSLGILEPGSILTPASDSKSLSYIPASQVYAQQAKARAEIALRQAGFTDLSKGVVLENALQSKNITPRILMDYGFSREQVNNAQLLTMPKPSDYSNSSDFDTAMADYNKNQEQAQLKAQFDYEHSPDVVKTGGFGGANSVAWSQDKGYYKVTDVSDIGWITGKVGQAEMVGLSALGSKDFQQKTIKDISKGDVGTVIGVGTGAEASGLSALAVGAGIFGAGALAYHAITPEKTQIETSANLEQTKERTIEQPRSIAIPTVDTKSLTLVGTGILDIPKPQEATDTREGAIAIPSAYPVGAVRDITQAVDQPTAKVLSQATTNVVAQTKAATATFEYKPPKFEIPIIPFLPKLKVPSLGSGGGFGLSKMNYTPKSLRSGSTHGLELNLPKGFGSARRKVTISKSRTGIEGVGAIPKRQYLGQDLPGNNPGVNL